MNKKEKDILKRLKLTEHATEVWIHPIDESISIYYHDNLIARVIPWNNKLTVSNSGWYTSTTKKRINQIFKAFKIDAYVYQRNFTWYLSYKGYEFNYMDVLKCNIWFNYNELDNPLL